MAQQDSTNESCTATKTTKMASLYALAIDDEQAKAIRDIFRWYLDGASVLGIIKKLSEAGIPSSTGKETWSKRSIEKILENEKYTGTITLLNLLHRNMNIR